MPRVRRVIVGASGSPGSIRALRRAHDLACRDDAPPVPVIAGTPPGGDLAERRAPSTELRRAWAAAATRRLLNALQVAWGGAIETTVLLLVIGAAVTELAVWGRRQHAAASRRAGYLDGINAAAQAVAAGDSPSALIDQVSGRLAELLSLRSCGFQYGKAGLGKPARLRHDGQVVTEHRTWDVTAEDLPHDTDMELLVENGGVLQGRFLMRAHPDARPTLEQRLVAIAFADQVGAALTGSHPVDI